MVGTAGVVIRTFALELMPAMMIITFHLVWSGPEILLTLYGVLLSLKIAISLLVPSVGLKSLAMADRNQIVPLRVAGATLIAISAACFWALFR